MTFICVSGADSMVWDVFFISFLFLIFLDLNIISFIVFGSVVKYIKANLENAVKTIFYKNLIFLLKLFFIYF